MKEGKVKIKNKYGIHARVAALIVKEASKFKSEIFLEKDGLSANCKSILGLLALGATKNSELFLKVEGKDEDKAFNAMKKLLEETITEER